MSHAGRLLVATPLIGDPTFERTVVLLLEHTPDGAFGVVLNRPSEVAAHVVVPEWSERVVGPDVVFVGGPVRQEAVMGLVRLPGSGSEGIEPLVGDLGCVDLHRPPQVDLELAVRLYAGSAGWAPGQLDDELREGAWWPVDAVEGDVFTGDPDDLWATTLRRQRGTLAWFANCPRDPTVN